MFDFNFISDNENLTVESRIEAVSSEITDLHIDLSFNTQTTPEEFSVQWSFPVYELLSIWTPSNGYDRTVGKDWCMTCSSSRLAVGAPVLACVDTRGDNALTIGVSDAKTPVDIGCGIVEETAELLCRVTFFTSPISPLSQYSAVIRLDRRKLAFTEAVAAIGEWWENDCGYKHAFVAESARLPMNSAWYSFHQALDSEKLLRECELSSRLGLKTIILDDGWQTDDNNRGYAYCGDWELATSKIPDMADLVRRIHKLDMKVMLWYSVPFVGIYSKAYHKFKDKTLTDTEEAKIVLDPRYPDVRKYLVGVYEKALRTWDLDGFKLDFVDSFHIYPDTKPYCEGMDIYSVEDAVEVLFDEITSTLKAIKPEILIEFRQNYIGPLILKYGNMVRVGDCPYDSLTNRRAIIDLRLTSGNSAVHSDMLMWHPTDSVEAACLQIISTFFGVPQVSVLLENLPQEHKTALAFWLDFYTKHRETLSGKLSVKNPEIGYTQATATKEGEAITVNYAPLGLELKSISKQYFVNSTLEEKVIVKAKDTFNAVVYSCLGEKLNELTVSERLTEIPVPPCGMIEFEMINNR